MSEESGHDIDACCKQALRFVELQAENKTLTIFLETLEERFEILKAWSDTTSAASLCDECIKDIDHYLKLHKEETK